MLSKDENSRYNRHLILDQVGVEGQAKLNAAKVLVVGAGGLGCPVLHYLTAAGVGTIGVIDFDTVDISNLQRQVLFTTQDTGKNKAECAAEHLKKLNPHVKFEVYPEKLTTKNSLALFQQYDIIVDGTDNFSTRYLVNDASVLTNKPLVYGSIYKFQGQVSVFNHQGGPSYRCLFPTPPQPGSVKNCSEIGVIGVLPGVIGTQQANETIKLILEIGKPLSGRLMIYDALNAEYMTVGVERVEEEIAKVLEGRVGFESFDYDFFCGITEADASEGISFEDLSGKIGNKNVQIIDLREEWETPELLGENVRRIVMNDLMTSISKFSKQKQIVLVCQTGARSNQVKTLLETRFGFDNIVELKNGIGNYEIQY